MNSYVVGGKSTLVERVTILSKLRRPVHGDKNYVENMLTTLAKHLKGKDFARCLKIIQNGSTRECIFLENKIRTPTNYSVGKRTPLPRGLYEIWCGPVKPGCQLKRTRECSDGSRCVNPFHLELRGKYKVEFIEPVERWLMVSQYEFACKIGEYELTGDKVCINGLFGKSKKNHVNLNYRVGPYGFNQAASHVRSLIGKGIVVEKNDTSYTLTNNTETSLCIEDCVNFEKKWVDKGLTVDIFNIAVDDKLNFESNVQASRLKIFFYRGSDEDYVNSPMWLLLQNNEVLSRNTYLHSASIDTEEMEQTTDFSDAMFSPIHLIFTDNETVQENIVQSQTPTSFGFESSVNEQFQ